MAPRTAAAGWLLAFAGCALERGGLATPAERDAGNGDADVDAGTEDDAGFDGGEPGEDAGFDATPDDAPGDRSDAGDAGPPDAPPPDAPCPPGFVDANRDPRDGCEYACTVAADPTERCNGADDDCDPRTLDGASDPIAGVPCDGMDGDLCEEGTWRCVAAAMACSDDTGRTLELCDGADNDCDGDVDEPDAFGAMTFFRDADGDGHGAPGTATTACVMPMGHVASSDDCNDADPVRYPGAPETCNARDEDCDGIVDDDGTCSCPTRRYGGHVYLFCTAAVTWGTAATTCSGVGYRLVTIDDAAENGWVAGEASTLGGSEWWIGLNDQAGEGRFVWTSGSGAAYRNFDAGEPDDWLGQDCVSMVRDPIGRWADRDCADESFPFACETL
jgi:hypothetical protein